MKNKILNLPFKKLTSLFTALVFFCNIIAPLPAVAQKNQPKKNITLEQKIASIKENVTVDGIEKFKSEVERLLEKGKGVLSPEECWEAKPQTMEEYVAKCLYGGAFSEDDEIIKVKSQKPYAYEEIKKLYNDFNGQFLNLDKNKRIEMLEESLADIFPEYYQNEKAMVFAYRELENFLKKQTESYKNELLSAQYPKNWYAKIPSAFYPFPSAKSTIKNSLHFSQEGKGKLSKFFHYNMILSMTNSEYCEPEQFLANKQNTFPDLFRKCNTALLSHSIPETTKILKTYTTKSITEDGNSWIISEPISQMILARYLKEFSSTPESPVMLEYYMLLGFADMLGSQVSYVHSRLEQDLDVANENDIKRYYWACEYALDRFKEYKNHLKQGNSDAGVAALKDIAETSGLLCFSDWWRQDGDIEKWKKDYLSKLIHYAYGMRHWQVRRVIDITTANAYLLMKALIYVDRSYGSKSKPEQPLPSEMQGIIEPILQKITGDFLTWDDFASIFRGNTLTTENINKEGAARNVTFGEKLEDLASGPIGNGVHYYAKNGVDNTWEDTKKQGGAALGMFQYLSPSFYIFGEAFKTDGDYATEAAKEFFSARTADFVSGLLELHKPVVPSIYPRIARVDPSRYWVDIIKHGPCDIGNKNHPNMSAVNNESCGIVDRALSQFDGIYGVYDEKDRKFVLSTAQERERIKKSVNFYEEAGKFARDFAVDAVVDYVLFFGVGTITKFVKAGNKLRGIEYADNSLGMNVVVENINYYPEAKATNVKWKKPNSPKSPKGAGEATNAKWKKPNSPKSPKGVGEATNAKRKKPNSPKSPKGVGEAPVVLLTPWVETNASESSKQGMAAVIKLLKEKDMTPEELGKFFKDKKNQKLFNSLFKDAESRKIARSIKNEDLGKMIKKEIIPFMKSSVASGMADEVNYVSLTLEKVATKGGSKIICKSHIEINLNKILPDGVQLTGGLGQKARTFKLKEGLRADELKKAIDSAEKGKSGTWKISYGDGEPKIIQQPEYARLKEMAEGKSPIYIELGKNPEHALETVRDDIAKIISESLEAKSGGLNYEIIGRDIRFGNHERSVETTYQFFDIEKTRHYHFEYEVRYWVDDVEYTSIYNVEIPISIKDSKLEKVNFGKQRFSLFDNDVYNELLISSYFIKEYDINGLYQNPLSYTNGRGFYFA